MSDLMSRGLVVKNKKRLVLNTDAAIEKL
ncbi:hypothetical protein BCO_0900173 (plasmid) [Borrelia coriaceae ATCC 43381]|uniref:Uncharacterized protein n=1 Tax=Borrelia coriaceae ATCC 43381 TaxID=1408429 RepID=W5T3W6_9SPIR|nr:hypothetical protein BCO_0900173 [Borrelia coriaceae ATCC 43381]